MAANTRLASAVQILCVIAFKGPDATTSEIVARSLRTNPVVVLRLLKSMERHGLVEMWPGRDGGIKLARKPDQITLTQIHRAVEATIEVFALRPGENPDCPVDAKIKGLLAPVFRATNKAVESTLSQTTLGSLLKGFAGDRELKTHGIGVCMVSDVAPVLLGKSETEFRRASLGRQRR